MKAYATVAGIAFYIMASALTSGVVFNDEITACEAEKALREYAFCPVTTVGMTSTIAGVFWPITWGLKVGIELTRGMVQ